MSICFAIPLGVGVIAALTAAVRSRGTSGVTELHLYR
jgi:hypothetical protein